MWYEGWPGESPASLSRHSLLLARVPSCSLSLSFLPVPLAPLLPHTMDLLADLEGFDDLLVRHVWGGGWSGRSVGLLERWKQRLGCEHPSARRPARPFGVSPLRLTFSLTSHHFTGPGHPGHHPESRGAGGPAGARWDGGVWRVGRPVRDIPWMPRKESAAREERQHMRGEGGGLQCPPGHPRPDRHACPRWRALPLRWRVTVST